MSFPSLVKYDLEEKYRQHYIENYCQSCPIYTFDNIPVMFYEEAFTHAFYKRTHKSRDAEKDCFCNERGERIDWIKHVLQDPKITPRKGYVQKNQSYVSNRRVAFLTEENYLVVIMINKKGIGKFLTAYVVDNERVAEKIRNSPKWEKI